MANLKIHLDYRGSSKIIKRLCQTVNYLSEVANGDMRTDVYDKNHSGVVDNAERLENHPASYFATASDLESVSGVTDRLKATEDAIKLKANGQNITFSVTPAGLLNVKKEE